MLQLQTYKVRWCILFFRNHGSGGSGTCTVPMARKVFGNKLKELKKKLLHLSKPPNEQVRKISIWVSPLMVMLILSVG
jgi:hypothetical protein